MTGAILREMLKTLDDKGVTLRGNGVIPCGAVDGHFTRHTVEALEYVTDEATAWELGLIASYSSAITQLHDDERMNGQFENAMSDEKHQLVQKKRLHGLPAQIERYEILQLVSASSDRSFRNKEDTQTALAIRGWNPLNRACLDIAPVLETAPEEVKAQRTRIIKLRNNNPSNPRQHVLPAPTQTNLLATGSGRLIQGGGAAKASQVTATAEQLDPNTGKAGELLTLLNNSNKRVDGLANAAAEANNRPSKECLEQRLAAAKSITAGVIIKEASGRLCDEVYRDVLRRSEYKKENETKQIRKKKKKLYGLKKEVDRIRKKLPKMKTMKTAELKKKLKNDELKKLCQWKKKKGGKAIPTTKDKLIQRWKADMSNQSPQVSVCSSMDSELEEIESLADSEASVDQGATFLRDGDDDETDDDEEEEDEE